MIKKYYTNEKTYTFDVEEEYKVKTKILYGKCRENGKRAWLDKFGIQFEGENRFEASETPRPQTFEPKVYIVYECCPMYPEDSIPITTFHNSLKEAKAYVKRINETSGGDIYATIYEAVVKGGN